MPIEADAPPSLLSSTERKLHKLAIVGYLVIMIRPRSHQAGDAKVAPELKISAFPGKSTAGVLLSRESAKEPSVQVSRFVRSNDVNA
jgi:hypothetical protein